MRHFELEVYHDPSYYDMWAVRPVGERNFTRILHFRSENEARWAAQTIKLWFDNLEAE